MLILQILLVETMIKEREAIEIAKKAALKQNWIWLEPISAERSWQSFFRNWDIRTNVDKKGSNIYMTIDGRNGKIIKKGFAPR